MNVSRYTMLPLCILSGLSASVVSCGFAPFDDADDTGSTQQPSIRAPEENPGKWFVSISIGGGVEDGPLLALRNTLAPIFTGARGGEYEHAIDIADNGNDIPTEATLTDAFGQLSRDITAFKAENPNEYTMLAISLTGHGMTVDGTYHYIVREVDDGTTETLTGPEIVDIIRDANVDETILILQSCQSGSLPNTHFAGSWVHPISEDIRSDAAARDVSITVVTPVTQHVYSPFYTWEEILQATITEQGSESTGDLVTYADLKDRLVYNSCADPNYVPSSAIYDSLSDHAKENMVGWVGIDPQFFERISSNLPLLLSDIGMEKTDEGEALDFPKLNPLSNSIPLSDETTTFCAKQREAILEKPCNEDGDDECSCDDDHDRMIPYCPARDGNGNDYCAACTYCSPYWERCS